MLYFLLYPEQCCISKSLLVTSFVLPQSNYCWLLWLDFILTTGQATHVHCKLHTEHCIPQSVLLTLHCTAHCILNTAHYIVYSLHYTTLHTSPCTLEHLKVLVKHSKLYSSPAQPNSTNPVTITPSPTSSTLQHPCSNSPSKRSGELLL